MEVRKKVGYKAQQQFWKSKGWKYSLGNDAYYTSMALKECLSKAFEVLDYDVDID